MCRLHALALTVIAASLATGGSSLECVNCIEFGDERTCEEVGDTLECVAELADHYVDVFASLNKDIKDAKPDRSRFKCFSIVLSGEEWYYMKGCTFQDLTICVDHPSMKCNTCEQDNCNHEGFQPKDDYADSRGRLGTPSFAPILALLISGAVFTTTQSRVDMCNFN